MSGCPHEGGKYAPGFRCAYCAQLQAFADADHARQPVCSWCGRSGEPYEYKGVRFDGLTACEGDRLCGRCLDAYSRDTPLLVEERWTPELPGAVYDLNRKTAAWSEKNIPGCRGEPPVQVIAGAYRYRDWHPPRRTRGAP
jgi:hypothetical protein